MSSLELSPLEAAYAAIDQLEAAGALNPANRRASRKNVRTTFEAAEHTLGLLEVSFTEVLANYRGSVKCHAAFRHDWTFNMLVGGSLTVRTRTAKDPRFVLSEHFSQRCGSCLLKPHWKDPKKWFVKVPGGYYEYSAEYLFGGRSRRATLADYGALMAAIETNDEYQALLAASSVRHLHAVSAG